MDMLRDYDSRAKSLARRVKDGDAVAREVAVLDAYEKARSLHEGIFRQSGEPYIAHPLRVAEIVEEQGGTRNMVIAALLHDTLEDTAYNPQQLATDFGRDIADIVDAVTAVGAKIPAEISSKANPQGWRDAKDYVDGLSNSKLLDPHNPLLAEAIYVKLADRLHNMETIESVPKEKARLKAQSTKDFLIPLSKIVGARFFEKRLSDLCFKVLQPDVYELVEKRYREIKERNASQIECFMIALDNAVRLFKNDSGSPFFHKANTKPYEVYQIYNQLVEHDPSFNRTCRFSKQDFYLYEIPLSYSPDTESSPLEPFLDMYRLYLCGRNAINDIDISLESNKTAEPHLRLTDKRGNRFLVTLTQRKTDDIVNELPDFKQIFPRKASITEIADRYIAVFSKDGDEFKMAEGSTVLDFAFRVHPDIGASAKSGVIRRDRPWLHKESASHGQPAQDAQYDLEVGLNTPLHEGDCVMIVFDEDESGKPIYCANLNWFNHITTEYARKLLIEFFTKRMEVKPEIAYECISWDPREYPK